VKIIQRQPREGGPDAIRKNHNVAVIDVIQSPSGGGRPQRHPPVARRRTQINIMTRPRRINRLMNSLSVSNVPARFPQAVCVGVYPDYTLKVFKSIKVDKISCVSWLIRFQRLIIIWI
jgi:hypothetical protein